MEGQKKISLHISLFFKSQARRKGKQIWNSFSVYPKKIKKNWKKLCFCQNLLAPQNQGKIAPRALFKIAHMQGLHLDLQCCALQALHLASPKGTISGEYYFTLTKTPPNPVDIYFVHIKIIFSKNLLFLHFPSKKTWKKCTEILHKASNLHKSTKNNISHHPTLERRRNKSRFCKY